MICNDAKRLQIVLYHKGCYICLEDVPRRKDWTGHEICQECRDRIQSVYDRFYERQGYKRAYEHSQIHVKNT